MDLESNVWQIKKIDAPEKDPRKAARRVKILAHEYVSEYEYSFWIDGNLTVRGNVEELIEQYMTSTNMAVFDRAQTVYTETWPKFRDVLKKIPGYSVVAKETFPAREKVGLTGKNPAAYINDPINCVYDEARFLIDRANHGKENIDPIAVQKQVDTYRSDGYPEKNGLAITMVLLRRHNEPDVIKTMQDWWQELNKHTLRDQLSFNYVAWKNQFSFEYMKGNSRDNKYFLWTPHQG